MGPWSAIVETYGPTAPNAQRDTTGVLKVALARRRLCPHLNGSPSLRVAFRGIEGGPDAAQRTCHRVVEAVDEGERVNGAACIIL